jgi:hypothetical protein
MTVLLPSNQDPRRELTVHPDRLRQYEVPFAQPWNRAGEMLRFPVKLIKRRKQGEDYQYKVRWLSLRPTPDSWIPATQLPPHLVESFENSRRQPVSVTILETLEKLELSTTS